MQGPAGFLGEEGGHPLLSGKDFPQREPAVIDTLQVEFSPQDLNRLIGQHGDEQMAVDPVFLVVRDRA